MKPFHLIACLFIFISCSQSVKAEPAPDTANKPKTWKLIFNDEFNTSGSFDTTKWIYCQRQNAAWTKYLTPSHEYAFPDGGNLVHAQRLFCQRTHYHQPAG